MSIELVSKAMQTDLKGDSTAKLTLIALANYANDENVAWPSIATLVDIIGKTDRTVQSTMRKLEKIGFIRRSEDQSYANRYRADRRPTVYEILPYGVKPTSPSVIDGVQSASPREDHGVKPTAPRGEAQRTNGVKPTSPNPLIEPLKNRESTRARENNHNQLSDDWQPDHTGISLAQELGMDPEAERVKFLDHLRSGGRIPKDLDATFRNWLRHGSELGITGTKPATTTPADKPHKHTVGCQHVTQLLEQTHVKPADDGYMRSALANALNHGLNGREAISRALADVESMRERIRLDEEREASRLRRMREAGVGFKGAKRGKELAA